MNILKNKMKGVLAFEVHFREISRLFKRNIYFFYLFTDEKLVILIAFMYGFKADTWYVLRYLIRDDLNPVSESPCPIGHLGLT